MSVSTSPGSHSPELSRHIKVYILVFVALLFGTCLTVTMYYCHFQSMAVTITIALFIATVKAFLVAGFFMHLISEKKAIYSILAATAFFFAALMYLAVWARGEMPKGTTYIGSTIQPVQSR